VSTGSGSNGGSGNARTSGGGGGGLKANVEALRTALELDATLALPGVVRAACEALCVAHEGPLIALVSKLKGAAGLDGLQRRVGRIRAELDMKEEGASLAHIVRAANAQPGVATQGPLCKQAEHLFHVVGIKE
jgi:hypothetical protein